MHQVPGPEPAGLVKLLPSDVHKQVLYSLVDVEDFIPEQTEAGGALQGQLPQRQGCCVVVQHGVTQNEPNCREKREDPQTSPLTVNITLTAASNFFSWVHRCRMEVFIHVSQLFEVGEQSKFCIRLGATNKLNHVLRCRGAGSHPSCKLTKDTLQVMV